MPMKIAVTSQNFRTVTGHAGRARKFIVYDVEEDGSFRETERISLPKEQSLHAHDPHAPHVIDKVDFLITAECGQGFVNKMGRRGIRVYITPTEEPEKAVAELIALLRRGDEG